MRGKSGAQTIKLRGTRLEFQPVLLGSDLVKNYASSDTN
jgi:hypothetical protein